ncbi:hypothetical protein ACOMHN_052202 [Nucella lapillus]
MQTTIAGSTQASWLTTVLVIVSINGPDTLGMRTSEEDLAIAHACCPDMDLLRKGPAAHSLSRQLSERHIQVVLQDLGSRSREGKSSSSPPPSPVPVRTMLHHVLGHLGVLNIIIMTTRLPDAEVLFREAERYDKHLGRKSGLRMFTQWIVATSAGVEERLATIASYFDNVVAILEEPYIITQASSQSNTDVECVTTDVSTLMYVAPSPAESGRGFQQGREFQCACQFVPALRHLTVRHAFPNSRHGFNQRPLLVGTKEWPPFVEKTVDKSGKPHYSGISMNLLLELARVLNFTTVFVEPPGGEWWGSQNESGCWDGLEVDLVMSSLHLTQDRVLAMDATLPFFTAYLAAVFRKPDPTRIKWKIYLRPFHGEVLLCLGIALALMTFMVHVMSWLDPTPGHETNEKEGDREEGDEDEEGKDKEKEERKDEEDDKKQEKDKREPFPGPSPDDGFWYMFGALLSQGGICLPSSGSSRLLLSSWWLFCMVIGAAYSGNLIAFLTVQAQEKPFNSLSEMLQDSSVEYRWGVAEMTSQHALLMKSTNPTLRGLWQKVKEFATTDPDVLNMDPTVQRAKVRSGGYVHITDSVTTDAWTRENCDLDHVVDAESVSMPVAVYLPRGSEFTRLFNEYVMRMVEAGLVIKGTRDHFIHHVACRRCPITANPEITLQDVQSVLYVGFIGVTLALIALLFEVLSHRCPKLRCWSSKINSGEEEVKADYDRENSGNSIYSIPEEEKTWNCSGSNDIGSVSGLCAVREESSGCPADEKSSSGIFVAYYDSPGRGKGENEVSSKEAVVFFIECGEVEKFFSGKCVPDYIHRENKNRRRNSSTVSDEEAHGDI